MSEPASQDAPTRESGGIFSRYGVASAVLGAIAIVALVVSALVIAGHRNQLARDRYDARVLDAAVTWVNTLINMKRDNVDVSVRRLQDGVAGQLGDALGQVIGGYVQLARTVDADAAGEIEAVAIERRGAPTGDTGGGPSFAERTDNVMVVATSITRAASAPAKVNPWHLRLAISKVKDQLLVTGLEILR